LVRRSLSGDHFQAFIAGTLWRAAALESSSIMNYSGFGSRIHSSPHLFVSEVPGIMTCLDGGEGSGYSCHGRDRLEDDGEASPGKKGGSQAKSQSEGRRATSMKPKTGKGKTKRVSFGLEAPQAERVLIAGDFNGWDAATHPMKKDKNGMWKTTIPLMPGRYQYRFLSDGNWENDRSCSGCVPNTFGSLNCVRIVE